MVRPVGPPISAIALDLNNALAYVVTNLHLMQETIERDADNQDRTGQGAKLQAMIEDALDGATRMSELVRQLRAQAWSGALQSPTNVFTDPGVEANPPLRILVIDDEAPILMAVRRALKQYDVITAQSGREALDWLATHDALGVDHEDYEPVSLILCDLVMGDMTGISFFQHLQAHRTALAHRVVFMTGGAFTPEIRSFLHSVPNAVLHKPFDAKTLRWMVGQKLRADMEPAR